MGRPLLFETPEELEAALNKYFEQCDKNTKQIVTKSGDVKTVSAPIPYTIEGMAVALDIDRKTILNYGERDEFFLTVKRAKERILKNIMERSLMGDNVPSISIFNLKNNYGYTDKQEHNHSGSIDNINITIKRNNNNND